MKPRCIEREKIERADRECKLLLEAETADLENSDSCWRRADSADSARTLSGKAAATPKRGRPCARAPEYDYAWQRGSAVGVLQGEPSALPSDESLAMASATAYQKMHRARGSWGTCCVPDGC